MEKKEEQEKRIELGETVPEEELIKEPEPYEERLYKLDEFEEEGKALEEFLLSLMEYQDVVKAKAEKWKEAILVETYAPGPLLSMVASGKNGSGGVSFDQNSFSPLPPDPSGPPPPVERSDFGGNMFLDPFFPRVEKKGSRGTDFHLN